MVFGDERLTVKQRFSLIGLTKTKTQNINEGRERSRNSHPLQAELWFGRTVLWEGKGLRGMGEKERGGGGAARVFF